MNPYFEKDNYKAEQDEADEAFRIQVEALAEDYEQELLENGQLKNNKHCNVGECVKEINDLAQLVLDLIDAEGDVHEILEAYANFRMAFSTQLKEYTKDQAELDLNKENEDAKRADSRRRVNPFLQRDIDQEVA